MQVGDLVLRVTNWTPTYNNENGIGIIIDVQQSGLMFKVAFPKTGVYFAIPKSRILLYK